MQLPIKREAGDSLEDRLTENAYDRILPARYLIKGKDGELIEQQENLFERVAKNIAVAELAHVQVGTWDQRLVRDEFRDEAEQKFGEKFVSIDEETAKWFSYDDIVRRMQESNMEGVEQVMHWKETFQEHMEYLKFMPNSPTLMNAGDELQQLSACFVVSPEDDIDDIHDTAREAAKVFQSGGGMGYGFWRLRPYGDAVGSTGGIASGPITFMRTYDQMCETIAQGGARRGAQMGVMRISHPDVIQFIHAKDKDVSLAETLRLNDPDDYRHTTFSEALDEARELIDEEGKVADHLRNAAEGHLSNFNISVGVTKEFMEAVRRETTYTMTNPRTGEPHTVTPETKELYDLFGYDVEVGEKLTIDAATLWEDMVESAHENGEPGVIFIDRINDEHSFPVESTPSCDSKEHEILSVNPCGEQPLEEYEACNLGHINLSTIASENVEQWQDWEGRNVSYEMVDGEEQFAHLEEDVAQFLDQAIDWDELNERIEVGTRFLDNVITMSAFPVDKIEEKVRSNRKIGLGIMGLAQLYLQLGVRYGDDVANEIARQLMVYINYESKRVSRELADERGKFANWEDSKYADPTEYASWFERYVGEDAEDWKDGYPIRNHNTTTIAPTGTTSMVGNTTGGCEPIYNVAHYKNVSDDVQGDEMLVEFDDYFLRVLEVNDVNVEEVKREAQKQMERNSFEGAGGLETVPDEIAELFVTTGDLSAKEHASVQCALQEGVDSAISKTVNAPNDQTVEDAKEVFEYIYDHGGKGVTYYRDGTRSKQVLTTRADNQELDEDDEEEIIEEWVGLNFGMDPDELKEYAFHSSKPREIPEKLDGTRYPISTQYGKLSVKVFEDNFGHPIEVWVDVGKSGGFTNSLTEALGRVISVALRAGVPTEDVIEQLEDIRSPKVSWHKNEQLQSLPDAVAYVLEEHITEGEDGEQVEMPKNIIPNGGSEVQVSQVLERGESPECPECGGMSLAYQEGCKTCKSCGWSECG